MNLLVGRGHVHSLRRSPRRGTQPGLPNGVVITSTHIVHRIPATLSRVSKASPFRWTCHKEGTFQPHLGWWAMSPKPVRTLTARGVSPGAKAEKSRSTKGLWKKMCEHVCSIRENVWRYQEANARPEQQITKHEDARIKPKASLQGRTWETEEALCVYPGCACQMETWVLDVLWSILPLPLQGMWSLPQESCNHPADHPGTHVSSW